MTGSWTFGQKMGVAFALTVAFTLLEGVVAVYALRSAVTSKDLVITGNAQNLADAERLHVAIERKASSTRAFLLTKEDRFIEAMRVARGDFSTILDRLRRQNPAPDGGQLLADVERKEADYQAAVDALITQRSSNANIALDALGRQFDELVKPKYDATYQALKAIVEREERLMEEGKRSSSEAASSAMALVIAIASVATVLAFIVALLLSRTLRRQIGSAVQHIQSSAAELQAAANQQASGTREQVSAMTEITTTIKELLSTSRQIAESAQRVVAIAESTGASARGGDRVVERAQEAVAIIKRQVDLVVTHMLDLGKRSQQIGSVLEIVNELLEQTNILAISATIEASGAGENGKRFAAVADEIRKLSDRVGGSAKEIRALVDEVRSAVNTTVMATEGGAKAVDAGTKQFGEVTSSFKQIASQVGTTTDAAREIELSTKQQTSAVEQVNVAIANVSQASKETEVSAAQTLQTASELAGLSMELARLVQPHAES